MNYHLAQINIGKLQYPVDHPNTKEFNDNIDRINTLAERSEGFIWRYKEDGGFAPNIEIFNDPLILINMSVWDSLENLKAYTYRTEHVEFFSRRKEWFQKLETAQVAMWWVPEGEYPSVQQGKEKLDFIDKIGVSEKAFRFGKAFPKPVTSD